MTQSDEEKKKLSQILSKVSRIDLDTISLLDLENKNDKGTKITCTCPICKNKRIGKSYYKPNACFIETDVGWKYTCRKCHSVLWLYDYLIDSGNKDIARAYAKRLWKESIFGYGRNYPSYPKSLLRRFYREIDDGKREDNYHRKYA